MRRILLISLILMLWSLPAHAVSISIPEQVGQGEPFLVEISWDRQPERISVSWMNKTRDYPVELPGTQAILLGAGLDHKGSYPLSLAFEINGSRLDRQKQIRIVEKDYPVQRLSLPESMVTPPAEVLDRIAREREKTLAAVNTFSLDRFWSDSFVRPVPGSVSSPFGVRRFLNDQPRAPHRGVDLRGAEGVPVAAMETGQVILTGDFYYGGKTVIIDHGLGFQTVYMHLSEIQVNEKEFISRGDQVGLVGMTGRATGPHLHLGVYILGEAVDPLVLLGEK
ncbi:M23 family metallopeptidase [Desulfonatronovibrio hydrogenovorans]|uniref:M23 family metallopeptidase n=1 Tax=Desulfonatronovibrio hydrogenovorans TaxID=53245 RepID=UPI001378AA3F|nr:M23 family metallopeptidase [Desulfonatronovibrio hydrogenovorans]